MKKYLYLFAIAILTCSCTKLPHITVNGRVEGLKDGVINIVDISGNSIAGQNITDGTVKIDTAFENPGYGVIVINKNGDKPQEADVYLEAGEYTINADAGHLERYPAIKSSSALQNELTAFYTTQDEVFLKTQGKVASQVKQGDADIDGLKLKAFKQFIDKNPNSNAAAHLMLKMNYERDVEGYYSIFQKLNAGVKATEEGLFLQKKLSGMMKLLPGKDAPLVAGTTPNGKKFDKSALDKKVYVLDFWKAGNKVSRLNHQDMLSGMVKSLNPVKVGFVSISLDNKKDWWTKAIADDKLNWTQYSDLKGDESDNAEAWAIIRIPTYYILNGKWQVIERDVTYDRIEFVVNDYLAHH
ncbi:thioredoxin-like domain-containing protein [uncultured Mucilaginibacter sp.]|uniref:TlpA family protein disulfide reductase n=1 Tax=uncultured Mucilaginibacter sp. TaxID=797541 RepID=UPI0025F64FC9|nr:thioredoxin-like domain-containing protein [uncultured Mucilaginibacter sp.]